MFNLPNPTTFDSLRTKENEKILKEELKSLNEEIEYAVKEGCSGLRWFIENNEFIIMGVIRELNTYPQYKFKITNQFWNEEKKIIIKWKNGGNIYKPDYIVYYIKQTYYQK